MSAFLTLSKPYLAVNSNEFGSFMKLELYNLKNFINLLLFEQITI